MSQFGGGPKPPGWARPPGQAQLPTSGLGQFPGQFGIGGAGAGAAAGQFSLAGSPMGMMPLGGLVNQAAFQSASSVGSLGMLQQAHQQLHNAARVQALQQQHAAAAAPAPPKNQRTFVGVVTKMHDNYGFVDDDVFFQHSVIRGNPPRAGDRVMVEATYNPSMPFKWNAHRVQLLAESAPQAPAVAAPQAAMRQAPPQQQQQQQMPQQQAMHHQQGPPSNSRWGPSAMDPRAPPQRAPSPPRRRPSPMPPPRRPSPMRRASPPPRRAVLPSPPPRRRSPSPRRPSPRRASPRRSSPVRHREPVKRDRSPPISSSTNNASKSSTPATGAKGRDASASPPRRRARIIPRYVCNTPRQLLLGSNISQLALKKRFTHLYVPSDFTDASIEWANTVPPEAPFDLSQAVQYHIFHKDVDIPESELETFDTSDADSRHQVKVLLLGHADRTTMQAKTWGLLPDGSTDDSFEPVSLLKNIQFLVGCRGAGGKELMPIGGPWSPSQDGPDPTALPTLIKTAIRTARTLTGIDLSNVAAWYQLAQVRYYRAEKGGRVDRVTLLLADTAGTVPDPESLALLDSALKEQLEKKLAEIDAEKEKEAAAQQQQQEEAAKKEEDKEKEKGGTEEVKKEEETATKAEEVAAEQQPAAAEKEKPKDPAASIAEAEEPASTVTHWSKLDVKQLKVAELKTELESRGLETKGIKTLLAQRLQEAVDREKKAEEEAEKKKNAPAPSPASTEKKEESTAGDNKKEEKKPEVPEKTDAEKAKEEAERKKAAEKAEKERKERKAALEKHYTMPKEARVLVFPSKTHKSGKFDCRVVSLQSLLEYRHDDNKEGQFEAALFAECVRDIVERSAAFRVYAAIAQAGEREAEKKKREEARKEREGSAESGKKADEKDNKKDDKKEDSKEKKENEEKKVDLRSVVVHRDIFEAFAYFDQNLCGYLLERDVEDIIAHGDLAIPRGQLTKLSKKLSSRDKINYRHLTDSLVDGDGETRYTPEVAEGAPSIDVLSRGFGSKWMSDAEEKETSISLSANLSSEVSNGLVTVDGSIVNLRAKLVQLRKTETEREAAINKIKEMETSLKSLKEAKDVTEKRKRRLEDDVEKYKKRLHDTEKNLKASQDSESTLKSALSEVRKLGEKVVSIVEKNSPKKKKEEDKKEEKTSSTGTSQENAGSSGGEKKKSDKAENGNSTTEEEPMVLDAADIVLADQVEDEEMTKKEEREGGAAGDAEKEENVGEEEKEESGEPAAKKTKVSEEEPAAATEATKEKEGENGTAEA